MGDLSKLSDSAKIAFLMEALIDAGETLRRYDPAGSRYVEYVREMRGEVEETEPSP